MPPDGTDDFGGEIKTEKSRILWTEQFGDRVAANILA
jgi:hypothetical protein